MITDQLVIVRGGGDIATGTIWSLRRAGFPVLILESPRPSAIRRTVALSEAVYDGAASVEDVSVKLAKNLDEAEYLLFQSQIAMIVDPEGESIRQIVSGNDRYSRWDTGLTTLESGGRHVFLAAVVDAVLAKKNLGTVIDMAPYVIALGPGFTAGVDCHVVIETMRGHNLARPITEGQALANTGTPGIIAGHGKDRVIHSPIAGTVRPLSAIGDIVQEGQIIAEVEPEAGGEASGIKAPFTGLVRGMLRDGFRVPAGFKMADIDPRAQEHDNCFTISDKARAIGNMVVTETVGYLARQEAET